MDRDEKFALERAKLEKWARAQLELCGQYVQENSLITAEARGRAGWMLPGRFFIGHLTSKLNPDLSYWVILGPDALQDHIETRLADTARAAARHFVLRWQLHGAQAGTLGKPTAAGEQGTDWQARAADLSSKAEELFAYAEQDPLWPNEVA